MRRHAHYFFFRFSFYFVLCLFCLVLVLVKMSDECGRVSCWIASLRDLLFGLVGCRFDGSTCLFGLSLIILSANDRGWLKSVTSNETKHIYKNGLNYFHLFPFFFFSSFNVIIVWESFSFNSFFGRRDPFHLLFPFSSYIVIDGQQTRLRW